jgi:hypothetical protein
VERGFCMIGFGAKLVQELSENSQEIYFLKIMMSLIYFSLYI